MFLCYCLQESSNDSSLLPCEADEPEDLEQLFAAVVVAKDGEREISPVFQLLPPRSVSQEISPVFQLLPPRSVSQEISPVFQLLPPRSVSQEISHVI